jgi:hypothetical protein
VKRLVRRPIRFRSFINEGLYRHLSIV